MKVKVWAPILIAILIGGFFAISSPSATQSIPEASNAQDFSSVKADMTTGARLLDVRTPEEYQSSYIEGAELFPLQDMQAGSLPSYAKDSKIYLYCRSGNRSAEAKSLLEKAGFTNVVDLGGYQDVVDIGGKLIY